MGRSDDDRNAQVSQTQELMQALGVGWMSRERWRRIARAFNLDTGEGLRGRPPGVGGRKFQVLQCIIAGQEDADIAKLLGISLGTVCDYKTELFRIMQTYRGRNRCH